MVPSFDSLILLIGTNPLPNYVVTQYFLQKVPNLKKIFLIHSETTKFQKGTETYAKRISELLKSKNQNSNLNFHYIALSDVSNASIIISDLQKQLYENLKNSHKIHLNYTGGTKSMGINVYKFLLKNFPDKTTFSYLDARTFQIVFDDEGRLSDDLRKDISVSLEEILFLHDYERTNQPDKNFEIFQGAIRKFHEIIEAGKIRDYFDSYNRDKFTKNNKLIESVRDLTNNLKDYKAEEPLLSIIQLLPEEYRIFNSDGSYREPNSKRIAKSIVRFLDGEWLEYYVYSLLKEHFADKKIEIEIDIEIKRRDWPIGNLNFQIDLLLINGYQLVGISCTTSNRKDVCKGKGFEIFLRTRQIGGEEAKAILITRVPEESREKLEAELRIDTGGSDNIIVIGEEGLKSDELINRINDFIK